MNNRGYSKKFVVANKQADQTHVGVKLGRVCVDRAIPVPDVAEYLGVSRQAVYMWFLGRALPHPDMRMKIIEVTKKLKEQSKQP
jgi:hypothetical protein